MPIRKIQVLGSVHKNKMQKEKLGVYSQTTKLAKKREVTRSFPIMFLSYTRVPFCFPAQARRSPTAPTKNYASQKWKRS